MMEQPFQGFGALQRFVRRDDSVERCELCGSAVACEHEHLVEPGKRRLICACQACAILFSGQVGQRYKRVPCRVRALPALHITNAQWESLLVPINLAFFFQSSVTERVTAIYPSPAGATESLLALEAWEEIVAANPVLRAIEPDVEGLLVNRLGPERGYPEYQNYLLPIDECFKLVGLVRVNWRGFSGGEELWRELDRYFGALAARAVAMGETRYA